MITEVGNKKYFTSDSDFITLIEGINGEEDSSTWIVTGLFGSKKMYLDQKEWDSFFKHVNEVNDYLVKNGKDGI